MSTPTRQHAQAQTLRVGVAGSSYTYLSLPMADLVGLATIVYLVVQIVTSLHRLFKRRHKSHEQSD